jgi:hypothetical protein
MASYNASKRGGQRRIFGLPHPSFIHDQGLFFEKHWTDILARLEKAVGSLSRPSFSDNGPRSARITPHSQLPKARLKKFSRFKFCVITDVARCFPSIYTHSIPWALNGKAAAKTDSKYSSATVYGNRLDFIIRQAQSKQTIGIPVGPDASRVISEIVLSAVDEKFISQHAKASNQYLRHVDDYWIGGSTFEECEKHLQYLRASLREFELDVNDLKTRIVSTNKIFGDGWPTEIENQIEYAFSSLSHGDPVTILSGIIEKATTTNDDGIIRHAIRKLDESQHWTAHWDVLEHFLAQCAVQFPHSFDYVARVIVWRSRVGKKIDKNLWKDVCHSVAYQASALGRDSETLWGLWLMKELKFKPTKILIDAMIKNNGAIVLGFLAHMHANGLVREKTLPERLRETITTDPYSGAGWPLALELRHLGLEGTLFQASKTDEPLRFLHEQKASLVDWNALPKVFLRDDDEDDNNKDKDDEFEPSYAIEDFTSDYENDDEEDNEDEDKEQAPWEHI